VHGIPSIGRPSAAAPGTGRKPALIVPPPQSLTLWERSSSLMRHIGVMRLGKWAIPVGVLIGAGIIVGIAQASTAGGPDPKGGPPKGPTPPARGEFSLATAINTIGTAQYPDGFAGAERLPNGQAVVYVVPGQDAAFLAALPPVTNTPAGRSYIVKPVTNSWAVMDSLTQKIAVDSESLTKLGIELSSWGPDVRSNRVLISMRRYNSSQARYLVQRYGRTLVAVSTISEPGTARRA
jgi:hypothetical protein